MVVLGTAGKCASSPTLETTGLPYGWLLLFMYYLCVIRGLYLFQDYRVAAALMLLKRKNNE